MRLAGAAVGALLLAAACASPAAAVTVGPGFSFGTTYAHGEVATQPFTTVLGTSDWCPNEPGMADWGDGQSSPVSVRSRGDGTCDYLGSHTYARAGSFTVRSSGDWSPGPAWEITMQVQPFTFTSRAHKGIAGSELTWGLATFSWSSDSGPYTAAIDWGDGQTTNVAPVSSGIRGVHTYAGPGSYPVKISLLLNGALQAETSTRAVVSSCTPDIGDAYVPPVADAYERWLMLLYRDVLGRAPERGAVDAARRALISGATRTSVALPVLRSPEAADRTTARMFSTLLGRPANPGESSSLIDVLESQEYADLSQPEFYGPDSGSLVQAAACDLLGRKAADGEVRAARMFLTRDQAVPAFLGSDDYRRGFVNQIYTRFLRRAATESELSQGATAQPDDVAAAVAGSAEYFRRANGGGTIDQLQTLTRGRIRVALRRAAELRVGVLRGGRRIGTVRLGHMARGVSVAKWRRRGGAPASLIVEAWSRGRLIDATDPIAAGR